MTISNFGELAFLNTIRNTSFAVAVPYIKLHLGDAGEDGLLNPAVEASRKSASFSAASAGAMVTSATITWTNVSTTETYSHWSMWDAVTGGNCLWTGAFSSSAAVTAGDTFQITSLTLTLD